MIREKFSISREKIINRGEIGERNVATAGEITATILVEQQITPLARAEDPAIIEDTEVVAVVFRVFVPSSWEDSSWRSILQ